MKAIYKFHLGNDFDIKIEMPKGAKILSVQEQFREGVLWAIVDPEAEVEPRTFKSVLTGHEFDTNGKEIYIGTYQIDFGNYVVHVFEIPKP